MFARALSVPRSLMLGALLFVCPFASAEEADDPKPEPDKPVMHGSLEVTAEAIPIPALTIIGEEEIRSTVPMGDGSEVLRDVTGADLSRMGGHGLEPFVRGQSQGDLTVLLDGATVHGGCPNRMDPATSYSTTATTDRLVVIRGVQTLQYGPGAPGGTVLYDRKTPIFDDTSWNLNATTGGSDAAVGFGAFSLRALGTYRNTKKYEDGSGEEVRSAAKSTGGTLMLGWRPTADTEFELGYERSNTDDALFAGAGMDAPESTADIVRFQTERTSRARRFHSGSTSLRHCAMISSRTRIGRSVIAECGRRLALRLGIKHLINGVINPAGLILGRESAPQRRPAGLSACLQSGLFDQH